MRRRRLFEALVYAMRAVAARRTDGTDGPTPLVLVLEDLHWADESTLEFVEFLLRSTPGIDHDDGVPGQGLLVLGTLRGEGLATVPALARMLASVLATRGAREMELHALSSAQLAGMLEATLGRRVALDVVAAFFERSEGNPFVAEELLGAVAASGHLDDTAAGSEVATLHLPLSLRGAVLERFELLPEEARTLLSAAAAIGRVFDLELLAQVADQDSRTLLHGVRVVLRGGMIEENPAEGGSASATTGDRYRFRHALTREVIYGELLGPERRVLHSAVARALEEHLENDSEGARGDALEALAYHYRLAGDRVKAPIYARRAAERNRALLAFAEARRHYAEALAYFTEGDPARLPLLEALGLLSLALLDMRGAVGHIDAAIGLLRGLGLSRKAGAVLGEMHHLLWFVDLTRFRAMVDELEPWPTPRAPTARRRRPRGRRRAGGIRGGGAGARCLRQLRARRIWARRALTSMRGCNPSGPGVSPAAVTRRCWPAPMPVPRPRRR